MYVSGERITISELCLLLFFQPEVFLQMIDAIHRLSDKALFDSIFNQVWGFS